MNLKLFASAFLFLFVFVSCKKETESPADTLTSKTWIRALNDVNPSTNPQGQVLYYAVQNCEKDDTFKFDLAGTLVINRNANKCNPNELPTETQPYSLNQQNKELVINGIAYTLAEESGSQIKYYTVIPTTNGFQYLIFLLQ